MHLTMFWIPVALEAFKASKEVLVRRPAPPGIRPFLENKRSIQGTGELELELIQTQMTQMPMLRAEGGMRVRCAKQASIFGYRNINSFIP